MIQAATHSFSDEQSFDIFNALTSRESLWYGISIICFGACFLIDWKFWNSFSFIIYSFSLFLLFSVLIFGREVNGAKSWFVFSGFSFQPSEFAKFATTLALASYLSLSNTNILKSKNALVIAGLILGPVFFILLQPDAGSALVFGSFIIVAYRAGVNGFYYLVGLFFLLSVILSLMFGVKYVILANLLLGITLFSLYQKERLFFLLFSILISLFSLVFLINGYYTYTLIGVIIVFLGLFVYSGIRVNWNNAVLIGSICMLGIFFSFASNWAYDNVLKPHHQDRINVWLKPEKCDPRGSLYNVNQSKTAIGSGGLYGKGFLNGEMTKLNYVPEQSTDFIVSTLGEEQGFVGILGVLILFSILLIRIIVMAERSNNKFTLYFGYGLFSILFIQSFINVGMAMGVMPVIGIPLPFISKGGSALIIMSIMMGVLLKMDMDRRRI